jgi:myo-inositol-1(or 4)-monophosphatase
MDRPGLPVGVIPAVLEPAQLVEVEQTAVELAATAGNRLWLRFRSALTVEYKSPGHQDPVTEADREIERFLRDEIHARFPEHGVLGEEGSEPPRGVPFVWVVDPLDGTANFINGLPLWAVSIGVLWYGRPVAGAIFLSCGPNGAPATVHARLGGGAAMNGQRVRVVEEVEPVRRRLSTLPAHYWRELRLHRRQPAQLGEVRTLGSVALELALVAAGVLQYGLFWQPKIWDVAAGAAIVREAGGSVLLHRGWGQPWTELYAFEPRPTRRGVPTLRGWRGSILAGNPGAARAIAGSIRARLAVVEPLIAAYRLLHGGS